MCYWNTVMKYSFVYGDFDTDDIFKQLETL